jgi:succinate-semialdehyde dehydrogenase/glutarate-semialdehyde dehydrogenase
MVANEYADLKLFIGGEWVTRGSRATRPVVNPATGATLGELPIATQADLDRALDAAHKSFPMWRAKAPHERGRILRRAAELLRERTEHIARLATQEEGKILAETRWEVALSADIFEWYAEEGRRAYGRVLPQRASGVRMTVLKEPVGPVAAFAPWNFPIGNPARKIGAALGAGCPCILKPAEEAPASALEVARALVDAGLPPGVLSVVFGVPAEISSYLLASPIIRAISFTGSIAVGKQLTKLAAEGARRSCARAGVR